MAEEQVSTTKTKPARSRVGFWRWVWRISAGTFAVLVVLLALFIGLFRVAVPLLPDYQQRIEAAATRAIGYPLTIGTVDARWRLRGPELVFDDVIVRTSDSKREVFKAERLRVAIDALELVRSGVITPSSLTLTTTELNLRRDVEGNWFVQGLPLDSLRSDQPRAAAWGAPNGIFAIQNVALTVNDELHDQVISVPDIDIDVTIEDSALNVLGELELERRGPRIEFSLDARGRADSLEDVIWTGFVNGDDIVWSEVEKVFPGEPHWSTTDPVDLAVWLRATGKQPHEASVTVEATNISVANNDRAVGRIAGRFSWSGDSDKWQLSGVDVDVSSPEPGSNPISNAISSVNSQEGSVLIGVSPVSSDVENEGSDEASPESDGKRYTFSATELNVDELVTLAMPVSEEIAQRLGEYEPTGQVRDLDGFVETSGEAVTDFALSASLAGVGLKAADGRPGFTGLDAKVFGSKRSGGVNLQGLKRIALPGVIREEVALESLTAAISWEHDDPSALVRVDNLKLDSSDFNVAGALTIDRASPDVVWSADMDLNVDQLDLVNAHKYFPVNRFKGKLLKWLDNALKTGTGTEGRFRLKGPLNKFPYVDPSDGEFVASVRLNDATLHYANNWPDAKEIDAVITFDRNSIRSSVNNAQLLSLNVKDAQASIDDIKRSVVFIEGSLAAELDTMRAFLDATPIVKNWGAGWADAQFYGAGNAQLSLTIPTKQLKNTQYDVALQFDNAQFLFRDWRQTLTELTGELKASRAGLSGAGIRGRFLGEPVELAISPAAVEGYTSDISLQGTATPSSLARNVNESLADYLSGAAPWTATVSLPTNGSSAPLQARLRSPLQGMAVTLPAPLDKSADQTRFTDALVTVMSEGQLDLITDYGENASIHAHVRQDAEGYWAVPRGELRFGGGNAVLPESEIVRVVGSVATLNLSEIVEFTQRYTPQRPWIEVDNAQLSVAELAGLSQEFGATTVDMVQDEEGMVLDFVGDRLSGDLVVPAEISPETPIVGQFDTLQWTSTDSDDDIDPSTAPSMRAVVNNFTYNELDFGVLVAHIEARDNLVAVREFTTTTPDLTTRTTGSWAFGRDNSSTFLVSELKSSNVQSTLRSLKQAEFLDASEATARLEMSWPQGWTPDYVRTMEGELSVTIGQGKLVSVDPGAGRVFGLLSIGALPRRLNLDFRDVFDSGFGFDSITGDFVIRDGNAVTDNLALSGPAANVVIVGRTGLLDKDYDQTALVYANFGSSLPLAGAIAGGPAVGAALLVVTEIFKRPLQNMGKVSYSITGGWDAPVVARTGSARPETNKIDDQVDGQLDESGDANEALPESVDPQGLDEPVIVDPQNESSSPQAPQ